MIKKTEEISREMKQIKKLLKFIPKDRLAIAQNIFNELVFIDRTLTKLKKQVDEEGVTTLFKQGKQEFIRENPALKAYNTTIAKYSTLYNQLIELLPPAGDGAEDELLNFIRGQ